MFMSFHLILIVNPCLLNSARAHTSVRATDIVWSRGVSVVVLFVQQVDFHWQITLCCYNAQFSVAQTRNSSDLNHEVAFLNRQVTYLRSLEI